MDDVERRNKVKDFVGRWTGKGDEKSHTQKFWIDLLQSLFGLTDAVDYIKFEKRILLENVSFIDAYIPKTKVLIEQKSIDVNLDLPKKQSDGEILTPYQQADRYNGRLPHSEVARWIVICNFNEFRIYDTDKKGKERDVPLILTLADLEKESHVLGFLVDENKKRIVRETEISVKAGEQVGNLHKALKAQYRQPMSDEDYKSLNKLCVRLVFCLYAEDTSLFGTHLKFHNFLEKQSALGASQVRKALIELFEVLNTKPEDRDPYGDEELNSFPYVNGGLFKDEKIVIPPLNDEIVSSLLASGDFRWDEISPTIFGAVFESTLESTERRSSGMHYTSIENIQKVINPLFMDELRAEFEKIKSLQVEGTRRNRLIDFQKKLGSLKFLDPACGSGNFLTETYIELRKMENEILELLYGEQMSLGEEFSPIQVNINQFYGIEINDFAVSVAQTALWIAESQMMQETASIVNEKLDFFPLKSFAHIVEGNALRMDWNTIVPVNELNYIMGNPPFCGRRYRTPAQQEDMSRFFSYKDIDYVACWFKKSANFIRGTSIRCAYVSTNSLSQGEQVTPLWKPLSEQGIAINFAYRTFAWDNESSSKAHVFVVIIGFSDQKVASKKKLIWEGDTPTVVDGVINGYLINAPQAFIESRSNPICDVPKMQNGNVPLDGDALKIEPEDIGKFKDVPKDWIKNLVGGVELLYSKKRYVLWLVDVEPSEVRKFKVVYDRVKLCQENRLGMKDPATRKLANTPMTFRDTRNPSSYIAVPMVSGEARVYIPCAFLNGDYIPTNQIQTIPEVGIYHFGVLTSIVHMAWVRVIAGRLGLSYRYSKDIVYNNFIWCTPTESQKTKIEQTAQAILDVRAKHPDSSLADLYDPLTMPADLLKAHQANDKAVMEAYGFKRSLTEPEIVAELFKLYQTRIESLRTDKK